ncbi:guanine nucleotide binding protein, alpha subunit [Ascobolus immersus RN42]|uniref:Guanine nucleotide binding protein, alpha subunit n=1 Tax=Ascobolus immersus RN42 TaxID=1160509 RepID=A0A3N4IGN6_ASCIM|nr:guanine nucleotide binding protein, alpha subunit [Ascobolus immersus RN42]
MSRKLLTSCCLDSERERAAERSRAIEAQLKADRVKKAAEIGLLLLGGPKSGKWRITSQMRQNYGKGYTNEQRLCFRPVIFEALIKVLREVLELVMLSGRLFDDVETEMDLRTTVLYPDPISKSQPYPPHLEKLLAKLNVDKTLNEIFNDASSNKYPNSLPEIHSRLLYFHTNASRLFQPSYLPTDADILLLGKKSLTSLAEYSFVINNLTYRILDVGGIKGDRRKWLHCFENVNAILFICSLSGYDEFLINEPGPPSTFPTQASSSQGMSPPKNGYRNSMMETLKLFEAIVNSQWFVKTPVVLFLNKMGEFSNKIKTKPVKKHFPQYKGNPECPKESAAFFARRFKKLNKNPKKDIYVHITDTGKNDDVLGKVAKNIQDMILQQNLKSMFFLV